jgi:hypothetical protein
MEGDGDDAGNHNKKIHLEVAKRGSKLHNEELRQYSLVNSCEVGWVEGSPLHARTWRALHVQTVLPAKSQEKETLRTYWH